MRRTILLLPVLSVSLAAVVFLTAQPSLAEDTLIGKITAVDGAFTPLTVHIMRNGKAGLIQAGIGDSIFVGDTIRTPSGIKARIQLSDQSTVNIGPDSTLRMKGFTLSQASGKRAYVLKALKGTIRFIIAKTFKNTSGIESAWKDSNINIETVNAVAGVRGTDLVVSTMLEGKTPTVDIAVLEGKVTIRSLSLSIRESVTLNASQVTTVYRNTLPAPPAALSDHRKTILKNATTPSATPMPGRKNAQARAKKQYTKEDAARELAANRPISEVLEQAASSGMSVEQMIAAALDAGVASDVLVYAAIADGYSPALVVSAAITGGAVLRDVVSAAITGGADTKSVIDGATSAGATSMEISQTLTGVSPTAPVYGYEAPDSTDKLPVKIPGEQNAIGTPPGETPSTLPASPSR